MKYAPTSKSFFELNGRVHGLAKLPTLPGLPGFQFNTVKRSKREYESNARELFPTGTTKECSQRSKKEAEARFRPPLECLSHEIRGEQKSFRLGRGRALELERLVRDALHNGVAAQALRANSHNFRSAVRKSYLNILKVRFESTTRNTGDFRTNALETLRATACGNMITNDLTLAANFTNSRHFNSYFFVS